MADGLPAGLVTSNTQVVSEGIENYDRVGDEDLARLWRAYATNRSLLINDVGRRLENFFWRVWGSRRCRDRLTGSQIAVLFSLISEGEIIRTTPMPSPRSSRLISRTIEGQEQTTESPFSPPTTKSPNADTQPQAVDPQQPPESEGGDIALSIEDEKGRRRSSSRPAPILKRPGIDTSSSFKKATILTPTWKTGKTDPAHDEPADLSARQSLGRSSLSSVENADPTDSSIALSDTSPVKDSRSSSFKGKKKTTFVVRGGSSTKKRPVMGRRKSSQTSQSSSGNSKNSSPRIGYGSPDTQSAFKAEAQSQVSVDDRRRSPGRSRPTSRSVSPVSSSPFKRPTRDHQPTGPGTVVSDTTRESLVGRNIRGSFVDRLRSQGLAGVKSPPALGMATSFQASGSSSFSNLQSLPKAKASIVDEEDLEGLTLERLPSQVMEEEDEDEDDEQTDSSASLEQAGGELPRVRSQLTMLLQDKKKKQAKGNSTPAARSLSNKDRRNKPTG